MIAAFRLFLLMFFAHWLPVSPLAAQLQLNPYISQWSSARELQLAGQEATAERSIGFGLEGLLGANQLAPLLGLNYQKRSYNLVESGSFSLDELQLQIGLAYRLRAASTSFNLVPHLAICPSFTLDSSQDGNLPDPVLTALENDLSWRFKLGFTLYLDFISLHYNWLPEVANDPDEQSYRQLGLGVRF
ncbi:MAG: hypothetical protein AAF433_19190 [Bacteroidota bacterium]